MNRSLRCLFAFLTVGGTLACAETVATASASTQGAVHVWVSPAKGAVQQILLTGVIGDHGTATSMDKNGTVDKNGEYVKIALVHGTFLVNAVQFNEKLAKVAPIVNKSNCSVSVTGSGDVTLYDGTGSYAGIKGTVTMTTSFAAITPRFTSGAKKGQCDANGNPLSQFEAPLTGIGSITI